MTHEALVTNDFFLQELAKTNPFQQRKLKKQDAFMFSFKMTKRTKESISKKTVQKSNDIKPNKSNIINPPLPQYTNPTVVSPSDKNEFSSFEVETLNNMNYFGNNLNNNQSPTNIMENSRGSLESLFNSVFYPNTAYNT